MAGTPNSGRSLVSHTAIVALALALGQAAAYLVSVVAARALGPDQFGIFAALLGILLIGSVLAMGLQAVAARRLVHVTIAERGPVAASLMRAGLIGGLAVTAATLAVAPFLRWWLDISSWPVLVGVALTFVPLTWAGATYGVAQGREDYRRLAAAYALVGLGRGIGGVIGALVTGGVLGTIVGLLVGTTAGAIAARLIISPLVARPAAHLHRVASETAHATHALLALFVLTNIDVLLARALLTAEDAGLYGVGVIVAKVAFWLPQFVGVVAFPRFADARRGRATVATVGAVFGIGVAVVGATALLPGLVVGIAGGPQYTALVPVAWICAAAGAVFALGQALLLTRLAIDDRRAVIVVWSAAGLLVVLATWVLPHTVTGLVMSALIAGLALATVGVSAAVREVRLGKDHG